LSFEIVKGDYGRTYRGIVKGVDYSDCAGKIYVWDPDDDTKLIDGAACTVSLSGSDTHIDYTVQQNDFATASIKTYRGEFQFTKTGVVEHTLPFTWAVKEAPPA